jgi:heat shock protein HtpX
VNPAAAHMYIVNPLAGLKGANFSGLFSTHPPIEERIKRLREMARSGY